MRLLFTLSLLFLLTLPAAALTNCFDDSDCLAGQQYCSTDAKLCVDSRWVTIAPARQQINLNEKADFMVTVRDPVGKASTYDIQLSGTGRYFAKFFGSQSEIRIALQPGEVKQIPLQFSPPSVKSYTIEVQGVDVNYNSQPGGIYSELDASYVEVRRSRTGLVAISAPGPSYLAYLALAAVGGFIYLGKGKNGKK